MTTVTESDMALPYGSPVEVEKKAHVRARAGERARHMVTVRARRWVAVTRRDVAGAWVWRDVPPSLAAVIAAAKDPPNVPGDHAGLRRAMQVYGFGVAAPITAVGYLLIWLHQHLVRALVTDLIIAALVVMWIYL